MAEHQLPKLATRVRFPSPAPRRSKLCIACSDFFIKVRVCSRRCSSFSAKVTLGSPAKVASALAAARCRYRPFAGGNVPFIEHNIDIRLIQIKETMKKITLHF